MRKFSKTDVYCKGTFLANLSTNIFCHNFYDANVFDLKTEQQTEKRLLQVSQLFSKYTDKTSMY